MLDLWGKRRDLPGDYPLLWHMLDTAAAALVLWRIHLPVGARAWIADQLGMEVDAARTFVAFLAALHDLGKACPCFQENRRRSMQGWISHADVTYLTLPAVLGLVDEDQGPLVRSATYRIAELLGGHHGEFPNPKGPRIIRHPDRYQPGQLGGPEWQQRRRALVELLREVLGDPELPDAVPSPAAGVLAGLVILADWIASDTQWIKKVQWHAPLDPVQRWDHTVSAIQNRMVNLGLFVPAFLREVTVQRLIGEEPNPLQRSIEEEFHPAEAGLLVITAPTGMGKTEAAFVAAYLLGRATKRPGMVMCLPTQATTNAMWQRDVPYAKRSTSSDRPVTLVHAMSAFYQPYRDYCAADEAMEWLNGPNKALLAGMSVVTLDQVLIAGLAARFGPLRLWSLAGKTVIVDEVHAADAYMVALLARVLSWYGYLRVPVILLSATLPGHIAAELTKAYLSGVDPHREPIIEAPTYPGWMFTSVTGHIHRPRAESVIGIRESGARTARVERVTYPVGQRITEVLRWAQIAEREGGCVAVVCTTVASAQRTFEEVRRSVDKNMPVRLLHGRFPYRQRQKIEGEVMGWFGKDATVANGQRPPRAVVVATSVLEQSLDVDFDLVISDLVPMALLLQRLGRAWRHERDERPSWVDSARVVVLDPDLSVFPAEWTNLYSPYELAATRKTLTGLATQGFHVEVPEDVDRLVQQVHNLALPPLGEEDPARSAEWTQRNAMTATHRALAGYAAIPPPHQLGDLRDMTRPHVEDADVTTRMGVDYARLIPYYTDAAGRWFLDPERTRRIPTGKPTDQQIAAMIDESVRCPAGWVSGWDNPRRAAWARTSLRQVVPFPMPGHDGLTLDPDLGLRNARLVDAL